MGEEVSSCAAATVDAYLTLVRLKAERAVAKAVESLGAHEWLGPARQLGASTSPIR